MALWVRINPCQEEHGFLHTPIDSDPFFKKVHEKRRHHDDIGVQVLLCKQFYIKCLDLFTATTRFRALAVNDLATSFGAHATAKTVHFTSF